ncbi:MAG: TnpV protein, partial [Lachnospiraceae bacterium]|nr:TnpV protein [Lachnospiraceae bacterium]
MQQNMVRLKSLAKTYGLPPWIFSTGNPEEICNFIIACDEGGLPLSDTAREYLDRTLMTSLDVLEMMELLTAQMAKSEGVTEALKAHDQMSWVAAMNSIKNRAEEIVLNDLIYT